ncbi:Cyclin-A2, partial [Trichinella pseudospiralis]
LFTMASQAAVSTTDLNNKDDSLAERPKLQVRNTNVASLNGPLRENKKRKALHTMNENAIHLQPPDNWLRYGTGNTYVLDTPTPPKASRSQFVQTLNNKTSSVFHWQNDDSASSFCVLEASSTTDMESSELAVGKFRYASEFSSHLNDSNSESLINCRDALGAFNLDESSFVEAETKKWSSDSSTDAENSNSFSMNTVESCAAEKPNDENKSPLSKPAHFYAHSDHGCYSSCAVCSNTYDDFTHDYFKKIEMKYHPDDYMKKQTSIQPGMRSILVDWLIDVSSEFNLEEQTLQLGVSLTDRFLSRMGCNKSKLQLVGTTALMIASKYEEIFPPKPVEFIQMTDDSYTLQQAIRLERIMLKTCDFMVNVPTIHTFLSQYLCKLEANTSTRCLALYLSNLALMDYNCLQYLPSELAAASAALSFKMSGDSSIGKRLEACSGYNMTALKPIMRLLLPPPSHIHNEKKNRNKSCLPITSIGFFNNNILILHCRSLPSATILILTCQIIKICATQLTNKFVLAYFTIRKMNYFKKRATNII